MLDCRKKIDLNIGGGYELKDSNYNKCHPWPSLSSDKHITSY